MRRGSSQEARLRPRAVCRPDGGGARRAAASAKEGNDDAPCAGLTQVNETQPSISPVSGRGYYTAGKWRLPTEERCKINEKSRKRQWPGLTKQQAREGGGLEADTGYQHSGPNERCQAAPPSLPK